MMQYFEWDAQRMGVTAVWIPPTCKGKEQNDVGYGTYDLFDLGNSTRHRPRKYGTRQELQGIKALHEHHVGVYLDAVMNLKQGADYTEKFMARSGPAEPRQREITDAYGLKAGPASTPAAETNIPTSNGTGTAPHRNGL